MGGRKKNSLSRHVQSPRNMSPKKNLNFALFKGKTQKKCFFSGWTTKRGGALKPPGPLKKKLFFYDFFLEPHET